jgi:hypothetical protein
MQGPVELEARKNRGQAGCTVDGRKLLSPFQIKQCFFIGASATTISMLLLMEDEVLVGR